jgi:hypothetical protein
MAEQHAQMPEHWQHVHMADQRSARTTEQHTHTAEHCMHNEAEAVGSGSETINQPEVSSFSSDIAM